MILQTPYTLRNATEERRALIGQLWASNFIPANENTPPDFTPAVETTVIGDQCGLKLPISETL